MADGPIIDVKKEDIFMDQYHADLAWLENPEVFAVNRLEAHSDHRFYESREEADGGIMKLRQSLNGIWKFSYAPKPEQRKKDFCKSCRDMENVSILTRCIRGKVTQRLSRPTWTGRIILSEAM